MECMYDNVRGRAHAAWQAGPASFSVCLREVPVDLPPASGSQLSLLALTSGGNQPHPQNRTQPSRVQGFVLLNVGELGWG